MDWAHKGSHFVNVIFYTLNITGMLIYPTFGIYSIYSVSRGKVPEFGRLFLKLKYADLTKNTYIRS